MRVEFVIDSEDERPNAEAAAHVMQNHPEITGADEIVVVATHHDNAVTAVYCVS